MTNTKTPPRLEITLRPLEREDLRFVHSIDNNASVMRYWFEEPFETFAELSALYEEHIHDQRERRFVVEELGAKGRRAQAIEDKPILNSKVGLVELVEIDHVHRRAEFQIIVTPEHQGKGIASRATRLAMEYGFSVLNLYKIYLIVDKGNNKARNIYDKLGFKQEGEFKDEFFINGQYRDVIRMRLFQHEYLTGHRPAHPTLLTPTAQ